MLRYLSPLLALFCLSSLFAQQNDNGDPMAISSSNRAPNITHSSAIDFTLIEAGDEVEGDYIGEMKFTPDGKQVWVLHRATNNISVMDWESQTVLKNIPVGTMPVDLDFSNDLAVVACFVSNEVYFIRLDDFSVARIEPVAESPAKVHVSEAGNRVVVGCDNPDIAEVFDLTSLTKIHSITNFPVILDKFSLISSNPRNSIYFSNFRISPDEKFLINATGDSGMQFWNLETGILETTVVEAVNCSQIALSGDGQKVIAVNNSNPGKVFQVDIATRSLLQQMTLSGVSIFSMYSPPAVNANGDKVLVSSNPGNTTLIDFASNTWQHVATGNTPDWVGRSSDADLFIASDYYTAIIDPETGSILSSLDGISIQNGAVGNGKRIIATDPLRYEALIYYDFSTANTLEQIGTSPTGSMLEADATYSVKFTPDQKKLLAVNALSGTLSVIDVEEERLEKIIPLGSFQTYHVAITSDSRYALVAKRLENSVAIIDLQTLEIVADVSSGGSKPDQVFIVPGDEFAYAMNAGGGDNIGVIALDGASSSLITTFPVGNTGISWSNYGIRSDLKFTTNGEYALLATPFDEQVQVIGLSEVGVVDNIPLPGFPLQIAISPDDGAGHIAAVLLKNTSELAILSGQAGNWELIGKYPCLNNPVRVAYDPLEAQFWVASSQTAQTQRFSLENLEFDTLVNYDQVFPLAIDFSDSGRRFSLLQSPDTDLAAHRLEIQDAGSGSSYSFDLPNLPIHHFDFSADGSMVAVAHPGSDEVSLFKETGVGFTELLIAANMESLHIFPNPGSDVLSFTYQQQKFPVEAILFDGAGQRIWKRQLYQNSISMSNFPSGFYYLEIQDGKRSFGAKWIKQ